MKPFHTCTTAVTSFLLLFTCMGSTGFANQSEDPQTQQATPEPKPLPDLSIPKGADAKTLSAIVAKAKAVSPASPAQYQAMQTAIRDASRALIKQMKGKEDSNEYKQAELDTITASVALMTFFGEDAKKKTVEQVHNYLKNKETLSITDIQTGMMAAAMLELQPNKKPARDTYELMDELLEEDEREEMQSLRINLKANVRRLQLLGSKFEIDAKALSGDRIKTDNYAGKYVIVDFFATWCQPCLAEVPRLRKQFEKYRSKGLEVVGISLDQDDDALATYLDNEKLPWPVIHDSAEDPMKTLQMRFGVAQLPTVLLLNKEGTVISLEARGAELDRLMDLLFESPTPAPARPDDAENTKPAAGQ
ncbi:MAG: TlpA disulfide reductase family protein [Planctomycetota bacterium]